MNFQRILELLDTLAECDKLPAGMFRVWVRANARKQLNVLLAHAVARNVVGWCTKYHTIETVANVESPR